MRRRSLLGLVIAVVVASGAALAQAPTPRILVDGRPVAPADPILMRDGRVYVPLRFFAEVLGADVRWDAATRTVIITRGRAGSPPAGEDVVIFFYLANRSGDEVRVRARVDGRVLFERRLPAAARPQPGVVPPPPPYPVLELKVALPRTARTLEIEEDLTLRMRRMFNIEGFDRVGAGFRITLARDGIALAQDYQPIR